ncbi:TetR/AcrR family transcriptional regulator [Novosphingobium sp. 9]|uniref:TetR/AcrR family transcriptional regulator n=1 Tax=Novosphingobium sp. 9 TaxID=2025349 RepID=UPI0021B68BA4|nr:TetR/AcrR family transcriptional regulator [Novosphingobium sp. 9]
MAEDVGTRPYHHGDLRGALLAEGMRLLTTRDADALSLREVARAVGVSATSVYRHFPDKQALMTALAREGIARLGAEQQVAAVAAGGGTAGFAATGRVYIRFALENPALFRLIFASPVLGEPGDPNRKDSEAGLLLQAHAAALGREQGRDAHVQAIRSWSLVHGLAMLMLDGQIPADLDFADSLLGQAPV